MKLIQGDCLEVMKALPDNSVDACVTDPPYGLKFMGKKWDYDVPTVEQWKEVYRVMKPGAFLLSFGGTRTYHRMVVNIEDAGFEIRDQIQWLYGSGFPKSLDVGKAIDKMKGVEREVVGNIRAGFGNRNGKTDAEGSVFMNSLPESLKHIPVTTPATPKAIQWDGYGTALKPANEPICLARKPLSEKTVAANVLKWGTGGLNIDGCRVEASENTHRKNKAYSNGDVYSAGDWGEYTTGSDLGRFPANVIHDGSDEVVGLFPNTVSKWGHSNNKGNKLESNINYVGTIRNSDGNEFRGDSGSAARFFYVAKASKAERNKGLDSTLTVKYNIPKTGGVLCEEVTVAVQLLQKVMSEQGLVSFSIGESGESIMALCHRDSLSTILTETNRIIESKTLPLWMPSLINESTLVANSGMVNGGNPVANVGNLRKWLLTITKENLELVRGASNVALQMLLLINEKGNWQPFKNTHSTVKPLKLMCYLCRLVTPPGGTVLDCYVGSGTTGVAAQIEGFEFIGIDKDINIATRRIEDTDPLFQAVRL